MIEVPKLVLILLVGFLAWYAVRWVNGTQPRGTRPRGTQQRQRADQRPGPGAARTQTAVEDLTACRACGAYVAASARSCGKPGCPQPA
jgi:hypothetical protein